MRLPTLLTLLALSATLLAQAPIQTRQGAVQGKLVADNQVRAYLGIPYALPPTGDLRWRAPKPFPAWKGVRFATAFGNHCIQFANYGDMVFRDPGPSEDCLTVNLWTPANATSQSALPVMVWIHGGGFVGGGSSEPRQDGQFLARRGVIVVSMNYRLGMLGFFTHPKLTAESGHHASGNYGFLDQAAALAWVKENISAFGGDPNNITLFGESAGAFSVSALMASPLTRNLLSKAIGESGAAFHNRSMPFDPLAQRERADLAKAKAALTTTDMTELRAIPAVSLAGHTALQGASTFPPDIDGYFLPDTMEHLYAQGKQAHIPLLAGWNADEIRSSVTLSKTPTTPATFTALMQKEFGDQSKQALSVYPATTDAEALTSAGDFASDKFLVFATWHWIEAQTLTGQSPVYRYRLDLPAPPSKFHPNSDAFHSDDIEYVFGTLDSRPAATWRPIDRTLSDQIQQYWTNFARTGNPNAPNLPTWPQYNATNNWPVLHLDNPTHATPDTQRPRYQFLDSIWEKP